MITFTLINLFNDLYGHLFGIEALKSKSNVGVKPVVWYAEQFSAVVAFQGFSQKMKQLDTERSEGRVEGRGEEERRGGGGREEGRGRKRGGEGEEERKGGGGRMLC